MQDRTACLPHRLLFTAIDTASNATLRRRKSWCRRHTAATFLQRFLAHFPAQVHTIVTDNGSNFTDRFAVDMPGKPKDKPSGNHPFDPVCAAASIKHRLAKPFHPQTNGMVERFNRRISEAIGRERKRSIAHRLFANHADRNAFLNRFAHDYNHTRLKCLSYLAPKQALANLAGHNTRRGQALSTPLMQLSQALVDVAHHLVGRYSGGMIRRLEIAQSLLHRLPVLFLDEPTVGLDPSARETVWEHVLDLRDKFHRTMIVSSHLMDEINAFCDRIALINRSRIVAVGTASELKARVGPNATLDDVLIQLVAATNESETEGSYGEVKRTRRAAREHG